MNGKNLAALFVIAATSMLFYAILFSGAGGILKFVISLVIMAGCGICLQSLLKIDGQFGVLLLRTKAGLHYIDNIANAAPRLWQFCADFGTVLGYGMSSVFFFKEIPKKTFMFSMLALILVSQLMMQKVFQMIVLLINIPMEVGTLSDQMGSVASVVPLLVFLAMLFFGLCGVTVVGLILNTYSILATVLGTFLSIPGASLSNAVPGASPVIPGINMPLFEGIIALGILLFFHELSHGILSRIGKVKLESAGILLFGLVPVGAFVDPDEKSLLKKSIDVQTRVFAAGSAANLILFILAFFLLISFESFTAPYLDPSVYVSAVDLGSPALAAGISPGDKLISIDNLPINWDNIGSMGALLAKRESVLLKTDKGEYALAPAEIGSKKTLGIRVPQQPAYLAGFFWLGFLKNTLGLLLILNFLVGVINLVPLFLAFDGYRIVAINVKNQLLVKFISYSLLIMFLLNFAPWLWK
jgi:hypothetical protein